MIELHKQDYFNEQGHIDYNKVVGQVNSNLKNLLHTCLKEAFSLAKDTKFRLQITETDSKTRDTACDAFVARQHVVVSEFYVEIESRFYTSAVAVGSKSKQGQGQPNTMDTALIELTLAVDNLISRSIDRHKELLEELEIHLQELSCLAHQKFNARCLHPQEFYPLFQNAIAPLNISADGKILLCKLLYQQISPKLNNFYVQMNQFLIDMQILASAQSNDKAKKIDSALKPADIQNSYVLDSSILHMSTEQFFAPVEQQFPQQQPPQSSKQADLSTSQIAKKEHDIAQETKVSKELKETVMDVYGPGQTGLDSNTVSLILQPYRSGTNSESSPAQRRQFVRALSTVQRIEATSNVIFQAEQIKTAVRRTLHEKGALDAVEIVNNEEKVIDFVSKIFQVILDDDTLCDAIKTLLAKLQISIIKLALIDFTFFQNSKHPARRLLNQLTSIGIGITEKDELFLNKLKSIVSLITENFETDVHIFQLALSEFEKIDINSLEQARDAEEKAQQEEKLKAERSAAKRIVIHTMKKYLKGKKLPNYMLEFCLKCWAPHMGIICMKYGRKSKAWRTSVRTLRRVVEVSQGIHSLHDVHRYIKKPDEFFNYIRVELKYLSNKRPEFDEIIEAAEFWYLTYLRDIEQTAKEIEVHNEKNVQEKNAFDNVTHLFKKIAKSENVTSIFESHIQDRLGIEPEYKHAIEKDTGDDQYEVSEEVDSSDTYKKRQTTQSSVKNATQTTPVETSKPKPVPEDIVQDEEDEKSEEVKQITLDDLPENIIPGTWLEIYQGPNKAMRCLKFSTALEETGCLLFTDRSGDYSLEIDIETFMHDFDAGRTRLIGESNRFDLALSSVISNIRDGQSRVPNSS